MFLTHLSFSALSISWLQDINKNKRSASGLFFAVVVAARYCVHTVTAARRVVIFSNSRHPNGTARGASVHHHYPSRRDSDEC